MEQRLTRFRAFALLTAIASAFRCTTHLMRPGTVSIAEIGLRLCQVADQSPKSVGTGRWQPPLLFVRQLPHAIPIRRERFAAEELAATAKNSSGPIRWHHRQTLGKALL